MAAAQSSSENPQYHHFIPQFILRNFAHPYRLPEGKGRYNRRPNGGRGRGQRKVVLRPGDPMLDIIDLSSDNPELAESPIRRTFGLTDMYRDFAKASDQNYLEKQLSKLESEAARIISKIRKAFDSGDQAVWLSRQERDALRRFLFIMKYRGKGFHKRFVGDETEGYVEDDKDQFLEYMHQKGFQKPLDVWLHSIKVIMELKMDLKGQWMKSLVDQIYPDDAMGFILHTEGMYLALCTPSDKDGEFLLTENSYNVFEGPQTSLIDPINSKNRVEVWTNFHDFAPVSPKLIMVLRSCVLPNPEEDMNEDIKRWRENMFKLCAEPHANPDAVKSILADLPIRKPRNSYMSISPQGIQLLENEDGSRRSSHRFCFSFFKLSTEHVNKINTIFLENAYTSHAVAFTSRSALKETIEHYLTLPVDQGFKLVSHEKNDPRLSYLLKLENILRKLDSDKALVYQFHNPKPSDDGIFKTLGNEIAKYLPEQPSEFMQLYMKLGGSAATMPKDLDQARRMVNMRIKIDVWSQGLEESKREDIRRNLEDMFCQLPTRRLWYYVKHLRLRIMSLKRPGAVQGPNDDTLDEYMDGPEDVIVKSSHIIRPENLGRLMHFSFLQHKFLLRNPDLDLYANITMDEAGAIRLGRIKHFVFAGNICDCGLGKLQDRAKLVTAALQRTQSYEKQVNPFWTENENIQMLTRIYLREDLEKLLGDQLPGETVQELKEVLFNIVYPTYAKRG